MYREPVILSITKTGDIPDVIILFRDQQQVFFDDLNIEVRKSSLNNVRQLYNYRVLQAAICACLFTTIKSSIILTVFISTTIFNFFQVRVLMIVLLLGFYF